MGGFETWIKNLFGIGKSCSQEEECLRLARLMLDEESSDEERAYVEKHIGVCSKCFKNYEIEQAVREVIQNKVEEKEVPPALVDEILERIGNN